MASPSTPASVPPPAAAVLPADQLALLVRYAELLAGPGVTRGLIGPREAGRVWDRHLLNCAPVATLIPADLAVLDVGSGAGLPGVVLAVLRPDLQVTMLEPMARRCAFLAEVVDELGLRNVEVLRGRAEELTDTRTAPVVTARAVAPLAQLVRWCLPLVAPGGRLLAIKGRTAEEEVASAAADLAKFNAVAKIERVALSDELPATTVVQVIRGAEGRRRMTADRTQW